MKWKDCIGVKVKKIKPDLERAYSMLSLAERRLNSINRRRHIENSEFLVEDYYECIKELITSILFSKGYKSYSHECLILFLEDEIQGFTKDEIKLVDQLRCIRNDLLYRGDTVADEYLKRREVEIKKVIKKLLDKSK